MAKQILFVSHESKLYGAPRSLFLIIEALCNKWNCQAVTFGDGKLVGLFNSIKIKTTVLVHPVTPNSSILAKISFLILRGMAGAFNIIKLVKLIKSEHIDIVYVNTVARVSPVIAGKLANKPVIVHVREGESFLKSRSLERKCIAAVITRLADEFICISNANRRILESLPGVKAPVNMIHNGINVSDFRRNSAWGRMIRKKYDIPEKAILVGFVGRLTHQKGIDIFLDAARHFCKKDNYYFIAIGGEEENIKESKSAIDRFPFKSKIKFAGYKEDVRAYFSAIDIFTLTSREENFGRVIIEAACMECAIIATRVGGVPEILTNEENAILIPSDSARDLINAIERIAEDSQLNNNLKERAKKIIEQRFSAEDCHLKIEKVIEKWLM